MSWTSVLMRLLASLAIIYALISLPIVIVTVLSRGDLLTLTQGILIFAASITALLVILGLIWTTGVRRRI
jgi:hypothetical protein